MKQKTHSGTKKRTRVTGGGKVFFQKAAKNHLLSSKSKRAKKSFRGGVQASSGHMKAIARLLKISR